MTHKAAILIIVLLLALLVLLNRELSDSDVPARDSRAAAYDIDKNLTYSFLVTNPTNHRIENVEFWAYAPVKRTSHQLVKELSANVPMRVDQDQVGNQRMTFMLKNVPPYGQMIVDVSVQLRVSVLPMAMPDEKSASHYLDAQPFMEVDLPEIQQVAQSMAAEDEVVPRVFDWVRRKIYNGGYIAQDLGALYALRTGVGDCSEHMYLLATLLRATGVPARGIAGFVAPENAAVRASEIHNWIEYYDGHKWVGMDSDRGLAVIPPTSYVAMRILDEDSDYFGDGSQASYGAPPSIDVQMN